MHILYIRIEYLRDAKKCTQNSDFLIFSTVVCWGKKSKTKPAKFYYMYISILSSGNFPCLRWYSSKIFKKIIQKV